MSNFTNGTICDYTIPQCDSECFWLECQSPYTQTILATTITWGGTALGASVVLFIPFAGKKMLTFLDASLGFAAGMMLCAAFLSMLVPALEEAEESWGVWKWVPCSIGFTAGCIFVCLGGYFADMYLLDDELHDLMEGKNIGVENPALENDRNTEAIQTAKSMGRSRTNTQLSAALVNELPKLSKQSMSRIISLCVAITIHNIPEGIVVGVGFASGNVVTGAAVTLAIALQNFPEGLAVAMPLRAAGESKCMAFFWGQASGMVEPLFGMIAVSIVAAAQALLPYALSFSSGCMFFVVLESIIPDANERGNGKLAAKFAAVGFLVMMALELGFEGITGG